MIRVHRLLRRLSGERGYSLIELLTVMGILSIVLGGLTTLFVSATAAQTDLNERYQAQQHARLALERVRRDIHCASSAATTGSTLSLVLGSYCRSGSGPITWCTVLVSPQRYALYRAAAGTCSAANGVKLADYITTATTFSAIAPNAESLARVGIDFPVDLEADALRAYRLRDAIVLRNSVRQVPEGA